MLCALLTKGRDTIHVALQQLLQCNSTQFTPTNTLLSWKCHVWLFCPLLQISQPGRQSTFETAKVHHSYSTLSDSSTQLCNTPVSGSDHQPNIVYTRFESRIALF